MARKKAPPPLPASPVSGKRFWLDPKEWSDRSHEVGQITALGGTVQTTIDATLDYLVLAEAKRGRKTKPPPVREAERVNKAGGAITVLYGNDLLALLCPSCEFALAVFRGGPVHSAFWKQAQPWWSRSPHVDLAGADLSGLDLSGFTFGGCVLDGAVLDGATLAENDITRARGLDFGPANVRGKLHIHDAEGCQFDGLDLPEFKLPWKLKRCSFRRTRLPGCELGSYPRYRDTPEGCDFTEADFTEGKLAEWKAAGLVAPGARFDRASLADADLSGADLRGVSFAAAALVRTNLTGANLTGASFRDADLTGADLTGANLDGADFTGANLRDTRFDATAGAVAVGLTAAVGALRQPGPMLAQLQARFQPQRGTQVEFWLLSPTRGYCYVSFSHMDGSRPLELSVWSGDDGVKPSAATWAGAVLDIAAEWTDAVPLLERVQVLRAPHGKEVKALFYQALCELFGQPVPTTAGEWKAARAAAAQASRDRRDALIADLRRNGTAAWSGRTEVERRLFVFNEKLSGVDLSGANLRGIDFGGVALEGANFAGADLREAYLRWAKLGGACLRGADLRGAKLGSADCTGVDAEGANLCGAHLDNTNWEGANLRQVDFTGAKIPWEYHSTSVCGADLTGARLDGLEGAVVYDDVTKLPAGFVPGERWRNASTPATPAPVAPPPAKEALDFAGFFGKLPTVAQAGRIANALTMLQAERFSLFAETGDEQVVGVVRSQSTTERVYACRLTSNGEYECGTQNLRPCGGLKGAVCKHLLVLLLGLTKAGKLDAGAAYQWLQLAQRQGPAFDKDAMTATFLKYKGVEAGEVDWRPTETVPEDYYAL